MAENVLNGESLGAGIVTASIQHESCFLAGTSDTLGTGDHHAIETLQIVQRVLTPESSPRVPSRGLGESGDLTLPDEFSVTASSPGSETAVDAATWRSYTVCLKDVVTGWDTFDITLLRPAGWMEA